MREEINDQNKYLFGKQQCIQVDGGFYCMQEKEATTTDLYLENEEVFVEIDAQGDKEIYFNVGGKKEQITNNWYEDDKPVYSDGSGVIVWQALIQDRYQIMVYNVITGELRQLTSTSYNNTNPHVYGNTIVWQAWIENNWEIFSTDIIQTEREIMRITNNSWDDMFPQIHEKLVTWQAFIDGVWNVFVYNLLDKSTMCVGESDGQYENPRFMLIMDNKKENGDVNTIGYDAGTGKVIPLGTTPAPVMPQSVPESPAQDQNEAVPTGGPQVSSSNSQREDSADGDGDDDPATSGGDPSTSATTSDPVIILQPAASSSNSVNADSGQEAQVDLTLGEDDVSNQTSATSSANITSQTTETNSNTSFQGNTASSSADKIVLTKSATTTKPTIDPVVLSDFSNNTATGSSMTAE